MKKFAAVFAVLICAFYALLFDLSSNKKEVYKTHEKRIPPIF